MNSVSARLLMIWLLCIVAGTLAPFNFVTPAALEHGLRPFQYGAFERDPIHFFFNILLFVPFGVLLHHEERSQSSKLFPIVILAGIVGFSIAVTIEYLQAFLPTRDSSLFDLLANTAGAVIGVGADRRWGAAVEARLARLRAATSSVMLAGLIGALLVVALLISGTLQTGTRLSNWDAAYPLLIGNEQTGDRPWRGRLFALEITDEATPAAAVRRFSAGESVALPGAPIARFDFNGGPPYKDASGHLRDLEWTERPNAPGEGGVWLGGASWLQSGGAASGLVRRLQQTNAFTLRVRCATGDTNQGGPARIVSNSVSPFLRNFTLGQQGSDLVFRLRTPDTGANGYPLEIYVPGVFGDHQPHEILASYDGATLLLARAHSDHVSKTALMPGASVALAYPSLNVLPGDLPMYQLAYVGLFSLLPGVLIGLLGHTGRQRQVLSLGWVLAFAVLLEATIWRVSGAAFAWAGVTQAAGIGAVVLTICNVIFSGADLPWRYSARDLARRERLDDRPSGISGVTF